MTQTTQYTKHLPPISPLSRLLTRHDNPQRSGFITRLDRAPVSSKIATFTKALLLNILLILLILLTLSLSLTHSLSLPLTSTPLPLHTGIISWTAQNLLIVSADVVLLRTTSLPFFLGECRLRITHGFRPVEILITRPPLASRAPHHRGTNSRSGKNHGGKPQTNEVEDIDIEALTAKYHHATHAVDPSHAYTSPSALFSSEYWTMEYGALFALLRCIERGEMGREELEFSVWKRDGTKDEWTACELWRVRGEIQDQEEVGIGNLKFGGLGARASSVLPG